MPWLREVSSECWSNHEKWEGVVGRAAGEEFDAFGAHH